MAITKKIRFEVFKRDGFTCIYCGNTPPQVVLEADHIEPKSKGGSDSMDNLITACFDCNRGKRDIPLHKIPSKMSENLEVLKEKESQIKEYRKFIKKINTRIKKDIKDVGEIFTSYFKKRCLTDKFKTVSVKKFLDLLPKHLVEEAMDIACIRFDDDDPESPNDALKYFCGICWKKIKNNGE